MSFEYFKTDDSPFGDGYDILAEMTWLKSEGYDVDSPDFEVDTNCEEIGRVMLFLEKREELVAIKKNLVKRDGAESNVGSDFAAQQPGRLRSEGVFKVHTFEAQRLFYGRKDEYRTFSSDLSIDEVMSKFGRCRKTELVVVSKNDKQMRVKRIGVKGVGRMAHCLTGIWQLTGNDNPFADYYLIDFDTRLKKLNRALDAKTNSLEKLFSEKEKMGYEFKIVTSELPLPIPSMFGSSYGARLADMLLRADYAFRVAKTAKEFGVISRKDQDDFFRSINKYVRHQAFRVDLVFNKLFAKNSEGSPGYLSAISRHDLINGWKPSPEWFEVLERFNLDDIPPKVLTGAQKPDDYKPVLKTKTPDDEIASYEEMLAKVSGEAATETGSKKKPQRKRKANAESVKEPVKAVADLSDEDGTDLGLGDIEAEEAKLQELVEDGADDQ